MFSQSSQVENTLLDALVAAILIGELSCVLLLFLVASNEVTSLFGVAEWRGLTVLGWSIDLGRSRCSGGERI